MNCMFTMKDIERMCREIRVSRAEAVHLLRRAEGDYKKAVRMYISERNVYVEPEQVKENERSVRACADKLLNAVRLHMSRRSVLIWAAALVVIMLALAATPKIGACMLLLTLFLSCRLNLFTGRQTA